MIKIRSGSNMKTIAMLPPQAIKEAQDIVWDESSKSLIVLSFSENKYFFRIYTQKTKHCRIIELPKEFIAMSRLFRKAADVCLLMSSRGGVKKIEIHLKNNMNNIYVQNISNNDYDADLSAEIASQRREILINAGFSVVDLSISDIQNKFTGNINGPSFYKEYAVNTGLLGQPIVRFNKSKNAVIVAGQRIQLALLDRNWRKKDITDAITNIFKSNWEQILIEGVDFNSEYVILGFLCTRKNIYEGETIIFSQKNGGFVKKINGIHVRNIEIFNNKMKFSVK